MSEKHLVNLEDEEPVIPNSQGIGCYLFEHMSKRKNRIGQICSTTGAEETFAEMCARAKKVAIALKKLGIKQGDIISLCTYNNKDDAVTWIGAQFLGCVTAAIDWKTSPSDMKLLLNIIRPKAMFSVPECAEDVDKVLKSCELVMPLFVFGQSEKYPTFEVFIDNISAEELDGFAPQPCKDVNDTAVICFSSGSTGFPKGICLNHYGLLCQSQLRSFLTTDSRVLSFSTLYWISSVCILLSSVGFGSCRVIAKSFDANDFWGIIRAYNVSETFLPPHMLLDVIEDDIPADLNAMSLKRILTGGSTITEQQILSVRDKLPDVNILQGYGATEVSGLITLHTVDKPERKNHMLEKPASCGYLRSALLCKIVDPTTEESLGPHQTGELRIKTKYIMNGYYNLDSSDCFDADGWFKTGDLLRYDEDGYLYHVDRIKEIFKYRQIHLQPMLLEQILLSHPAVSRAVVLGKPHSHDGHHPVGVVTLRKDCGNVSEEDILRYYDERVDDPKKLRGGLKIVKEIPATVTGKISRRQVRETVLGF